MALDFYCECGNPMCGNVHVSSVGAYVVIYPCQKCLQSAEDSGFEKGIDEGRRENNEH